MIGKYIKGMLGMSVKGVNLERFINKCNAEGIVLYSVYREKYDMMRCAVNLADFKKISAINRELKCRIRVKRRYGLKFLFNRVMRRKAFVVGAALFIVFMTVLSSSIWRINITGIDRIHATDILSVVNGMDAGIGIFKAKCDTKALELAIKDELPDVDWVIVRIKGVVMNIDVVETVTGVKPEDTTPASIISEVEGEIVYISTLKGDQAVKVGDKITPGQTLINGIVDRRQDKNYYLIQNAMGNIKARVEYMGTAALSLDAIDAKIYTGKTQTKKYIEVFGKKIGDDTGSPFEYADCERTEYKIFKENSLFPIYVVKTVYTEYTPMTEEQIKAKAAELLMQNAINDARRLIPINANIEKQDIQYDFDAETGMLYANSTITAVHEIGVKKYLTQSEIDELEGSDGGQKNND